MQEASDFRSGWWWNVVFFLTTLLIVAADQLSKLWIRSFPEGPLIFEAGFFRIVHTHNTGAVFGLFQGHSFVFTVIAIIGVVIILLCVFFVYPRSPFLDNRLNRVALGLMLGGTVGNLIDRLRFGGVTDFIGIGIWPAFNIADSAIVVGAIILAYSLLRLTRAEKHSDGQGI